MNRCRTIWTLTLAITLIAGSAICFSQAAKSIYDERADARLNQRGSGESGRGAQARHPRIWSQLVL